MLEYFVWRQTVQDVQKMFELCGRKNDVVGMFGLAACVVMVLFAFKDNKMEAIHRYNLLSVRRCTYF